MIVGTYPLKSSMIDRRWDDRCEMRSFLDPKIRKQSHRDRLIRDSSFGL
jgi:hypothetical protein